MNIPDKKDKFLVVGIGEILWDLFPSEKKLGGAPANFVYHANSLGAHGYLVSAVGNDDLGNEIISHLKQIGLIDHYIQKVVNWPTGTVAVKINGNGQPDYFIRERVAWDNIFYNKDLDILARQCDAVCFGTLAQRSDNSRRTILQFLQSVSPNCIKILDINLRQHFYNTSLINDCLELASCLKLNQEELTILSEMFHLNGEEIVKLKKLMRDFNLQLIALTKGESGSIIIKGNDISILESKKVNIIDTVGAGDAFTAGLIMGMLNNLVLKDIHNNAIQLAAYVCSQAGATPQLSEKIKNELSIINLARINNETV